MSVKDNLSKIKEQIQNASVTIIAVTKYASDKEMLEAYDLGINNFGESYVQNAIERISRNISDDFFQRKVNWHFIGRLQKNKAKYIVGKFSLIHSVDSLELVVLIDTLAKKKEIVQDILLQVNVSGESSKAGFTKDYLFNSFNKINNLENVKVLGLMTMAPNINDEFNIQNIFEELRRLKDTLNENFKANLTELSMGMSNDYKIAIKSGATMIRLGRAIFSNS